MAGKSRIVAPLFNCALPLMRSFVLLCALWVTAVHADLPTSGTYCGTFENGDRWVFGLHDGYIIDMDTSPTTSARAHLAIISQSHNNYIVEITCVSSGLPNSLIGRRYSGSYTSSSDTIHAETVTLHRCNADSPNDPCLAPQASDASSFDATDGAGAGFSVFATLIIGYCIWKKCCKKTPRPGPVVVQRSVALAPYNPRPPPYNQVPANDALLEVTVRSDDPAGESRA